MRTILTLGVVAWVVAVLVVLTMAGGEPATAGHPDGPVAYWPFDDDTAEDVGGHSKDGALNGGASFSATIPGTPGNVKSLSVDGINDYVSVPSDSDLNFTSGSWAAWINFDTKPSASGLMNPLAKSEQYWLHGTADDRIQAKISVGSTRYIATTAPSFISTGVWYHVVGTYDGETLRLYIDGALVDSNTAPSGNLDTSSAILAIGTWSTPTDFFDGLVDEVQVYNRALSADEIAILAGTSDQLFVDDDGQVGFGSIDCDGVGIPAYDVIQDAIDAAATDDTIFVCKSDDDVGADTDGQDEYAEDLTITIDGLELVGEDMSATIIEGVAMGDTGVAPFPTAVPNIDIRANEVSIHNFTIKSPVLTTGTQYTSGIVPTGTDIEIYDNYIVVSSGTPGSQGIQTWNTAALAVVPDDISGLSIHDNAFSSQDPNTVGFGYEGIFINPQGGTVDPSNPVVITDNDFSGDMYRAVGSVRSYVTIGGTANTMETDLPVTLGTTDFGDVPLGIKVFDGDHVRVLDTMITDDGSGNFNVAITIQGGTVTDSEVTGNTVETSALHGIHVKSGADGWDVGFNDVSGVTDDAIQIDSDGNDVGNNHVHNNGDDGIDINGDNNNVHHNDVHDSAEDGIQVDGDSNDADKNNVHHNGDNGIEVNGDNNNGGITDNNVHQNAGNGIDVSGDNNDVVGNKVHHNDGDGLDETGLSNTCSDNKIQKNGGTNTETCD